MGEMGSTFVMEYPPFVQSIFDSFKAIEIELPAMLPMACFFDRFMPISLNAISNLIIKTGVPIIFVLLMILGAKSLRMSARAEHGRELAKLRWKKAGDLWKKAGKTGGSIVEKLQAAEEQRKKEEVAESNLLVIDQICDGMNNLAFFCIFLVYPSCSSTVFNHFRCTTFNGPGEDGVRVMTLDNSISCTSPTYSVASVYAFIMLVICEAVVEPSPLMPMFYPPRTKRRIQTNLAFVPRPPL